MLFDFNLKSCGWRLATLLKACSYTILIFLLLQIVLTKILKFPFITKSSTRSRTCPTSFKPFLPLSHHSVWLFSLFPGWCPTVSISKVFLYSDSDLVRRSGFHNCLLFLFLPFMFSWNLVFLLISIEFPTILCLKLGIKAQEDDQK